MSRKITTKAEVIARATVYQDGEMVRGKIPVPVVKALEAQTDGSVVVRKATAAERKPAPRRGRPAVSKKRSKKR